MTIPIIGEPEIHTTTLRVLFAITCPSPCKRMHLFAGLPGVSIGCTSCKRTYTLVGLPAVKEGQLEFPLTVGMMP